jgi:preprotein translocase subunit SecF
MSVFLRGLRPIPPNTKIDFVGFRFFAMAISVVMILGSFLVLGVRGLNYGVDFAGGILMEVRTAQPANLSELRDRLNKIGVGEVAIQEFGSPNDVLLRLQRQEGDEAGQVRAIDKVKETLGQGAEYRRTEFVGPKVGAELVQAGTIAVVLTMMAIAGYIWFRFEWQFGVGAIVALLHDVVSTVGLFSLLQFEFNLTTLAAVLTIAGYSINDTVVVFDRIRENLRKYKQMPIRELINLSVNETLSRTIMTSGTTAVAVLALYLFGGAVLHGFSFAMLWGILVGTYSTIYVAAPFLIYFNLRRVAAKPAADAPAPQAAGPARASGEAVAAALGKPKGLSKGADPSKPAPAKGG